MLNYQRVSFFFNEEHQDKMYHMYHWLINNVAFSSIFYHQDGDVNMIYKPICLGKSQDANVSSEKKRSLLALVVYSKPCLS